MEVGYNRRSKDYIASGHRPYGPGREDWGWWEKDWVGNHPNPQGGSLGGMDDFTRQLGAILGYGQMGTPYNTMSQGGSGQATPNDGGAGGFKAMGGGGLGKGRFEYLPAGYGRASTSGIDEKASRTVNWDKTPSSALMYLYPHSPERWDDYGERPDPRNKLKRAGGSISNRLASLMGGIR